MPNGHGHDPMDIQPLGMAVLGGLATAAGQWLWRRLVTLPRQRPLSVREMKDLIQRFDTQDRRIDEVLRSVESLRMEHIALRSEHTTAMGTLDALGRIVRRLTAEDQYGD